MSKKKKIGVYVVSCIRVKIETSSKDFAIGDALKKLSNGDFDELLRNNALVGENNISISRNIPNKKGAKTE